MRYYIVPKIGDGTVENPFRAKYLNDIIGFPTENYGLEPYFLGYKDWSDTEHDALMQNPDVIHLDETKPISTQMADDLKTRKVLIQGNTTTEVISNLRKVIAVLQKCESKFNPLADKTLDDIIDDKLQADFQASGAMVSKGATIKQTLIDLANGITSVR